MSLHRISMIEIWVTNCSLLNQAQNHPFNQFKQNWTYESISDKQLHNTGIYYLLNKKFAKNCEIQSDTCSIIFRKDPTNILSSKFLLIVFVKWNCSGPSWGGQERELLTIYTKKLKAQMIWDLEMTLNFTGTSLFCCRE